MSNPNNSKLTMLKPADSKVFMSAISPILIAGETIVGTYRAFSASYGAVFTSKRVITITPQELTKGQTAFSSLPYNKIHSYSAMPSNGLGLNNDLKLWCSGLGEIEMGFASRTDVLEACKIISSFVL